MPHVRRWSHIVFRNQLSMPVQILLENLVRKLRVYDYDLYQQQRAREDAQEDLRI